MHDHGGEPEGHTPAPAEEVGGRQRGGKGEQHTGGEQVAHRDGGLRPGGPETAGLAGAVLGHEEDCAAPFAADGEALDEAQEDQEGRGPVADLLEGRQAAHQEGGNTDEDDAQLEQLLAAEFVAEVAEDDATDRAGDEANGVGHEGGNDAVQLRAGVREEQLAEDEGGGGGVEEELIPFDDRAGHGGRHYLLQAGRLDVFLFGAPGGAFAYSFRLLWRLRRHPMDLWAMDACDL